MNSTIDQIERGRWWQVQQNRRKNRQIEEKFSILEETSRTKTGEYNKVQDQNHGKAVATGFHGDSTVQEVEQLLRETIAEIGMSTENVQPN